MVHRKTLPLSARKDRSVSVITWISVCGVALGVIALIVATSLMNGFRDNLRQAITGSLPHVTLFSWADRMTEYPELQPQILEHPEVQATAPYIFKQALLTGTRRPKGALLRGIDRNQVERGQVLSKPGSIKPHTKFEAQAYILKKEEGGRHTPFFSKYRPQFYFRTTDVTGEVTLPEGTEMIMPGDDAKMTVTLISPIAMDENLKFAIREGGRTVGAGVVTKIVE